MIKHFCWRGVTSFLSSKVFKNYTHSEGFVVMNAHFAT
jgi:hypothetical protein